MKKSNFDKIFLDFYESLKKDYEIEFARIITKKWYGANIGDIFIILKNEE